MNVVGFGIVYRARQISLDRIVALKTVPVGQLGNPTAVLRFEHEAQAVAKLMHPNIITAYDFGRHEERLYFAMELVECESAELHFDFQDSAIRTASRSVVRSRSVCHRG